MDVELKKVFGIAAFALIIAMLGFIFAENAQTTADNNANITNVFEVVVNNTNLGNSTAIDMSPESGNDQRELNTIYNASSYPIEIFVLSHANQNGAILDGTLKINGTIVQHFSQRPVQIAQNAYGFLTGTIPKGANYSVDITGYHHYEWREYPILSGRNGTLSINQSTIIINNTYNNFTNDTENNFSINTTGLPPIYNYSIITGSNGNVVTQSGHTVNIAAPSDSDNYEPPITGSTNNVFWNGLKQWIGLTPSNVSNFNQTVNDTFDRNLSNFTNTPGFVTNSTVANFSINTTGQPPIYNYSIIDCVNNITCSQTDNHISLNVSIPAIWNTLTDVKSIRADDTCYHNNISQSKFVIVTASSNVIGTFQSYVSNSNNCTNYILVDYNVWWVAGLGGNTNLHFVVPPNSSYKVNGSVTHLITKWSEYSTQ